MSHDLPRTASAYLRHLRWALSSLPQVDRDDILRETESHFRDRLATGATAEQIVEELGEAETYAGSFLSNYQLSAALASGSAWQMLRVAASYLGKGVWAFVGFQFFFILFAISFILLALAVLDLVFPQQVGLWTGPGTMTFGFVSSGDQAGLTEHLGFWVIPISLVAGSLLFRLSRTLLVRYLRTFRPSK